MSERHMQPDSPEERPLFHSTDEQEQIYAPQQVPGSGAGHAQASAAGDTIIPGAADVRHTQFDGAHSGEPTAVPVVPVRPSLDANNPIIVPTTTEDHQTD